MTPITGPITLDPTGTKYVTREGRPVRIYAVDHDGRLPVIGAIMENDGFWHVATWTRNGKSRWGHGDLFLAPPPKRRGELWVNVYVGLAGDVWMGSGVLTREDADHAASRGDDQRIACLHIEWTEGDGLEDQA